jgi:GntR family transcriptional regulator
MSAPHLAAPTAEALLADAPLPAVDGSTPAYARIERWISVLVRTGRLGRGDRLPAEAALARAIGVSRMTLRQALAGLEARGLVERVPGRSGGTFIREPAIEVDITGLAGFTEQLRRGQVRAGARVVRAGRVPADAATAAALDLRRGGDVFEIVRVRSARRSPLALERSLLPCALFPGLLDGGLGGSLYARMRREYDLAPHTATEYLEPCLADESVAALLDVAAGSALLRIVRTASSAAGQPVEHASDLFRPDRVRVSVRTRIS